MAQNEIRVPGERLGIRRHGKIRAQRQGLLPQHSGRRVVHCDQRPCGMGSGGQGRNIADLQPRITRGLQPEQLCAGERLLLRIPNRGRQTYLNAHLREIALGEYSRRVVAVCR